PRGDAGARRLVAEYDDELWRLVPEDSGLPPAALANFVAGLGDVGDALDLGCGDGRLTQFMRASSVTGADVSPVALERFGARLPGAVAVQVEPDAPLPFPDSSFDLVLCAETIEHVRDVQRLLSERSEEHTS